MPTRNSGSFMTVSPKDIFRRPSAKFCKRSITFVTLNDFYDFLGISHVEGGDVVGWLLSDSMYWIDFDNSKAMVDDGLNGEIPCYVVDAEFGPQPESAWDY